MIDVAVFLLLLGRGFSAAPSAAIAFGLAAAANYILCVPVIFHSVRRQTRLVEIGAYLILVVLVGILDVGTTLFLLDRSWPAIGAKIAACGVCLGFNFLGRRYRVFPSPRTGAWKPQESAEN